MTHVHVVHAHCSDVDKELYLPSVRLEMKNDHNKLLTHKNNPGYEITYVFNEEKNDENT